MTGECGERGGGCNSLDDELAQDGEAHRRRAAG